jgi:hypothetical protein
MGAAAREFVRVNFSVERETDALCEILLATPNSHDT